MAEILAGGGIENAFNDLGIEATMTYKSNNEPYYEVWELNKKDLKILEEPFEWPNEYGWYRHAKGSNMGVPYEFFTVNGEFMIGWETFDGTDTYNSLMDYFHSGLNISTETNICAMAVDLARANGKTLATLFETYEG